MVGGNSALLRYRALTNDPPRRFCLQVRVELIRKAFDLDQEKPLPPVQVDKGNNNTVAIPVGEVLAEVANVLGKDMSKWKQLIEEGARRRERGGRRFSGPRPVVTAPVLGGLAGAGTGLNTEGLQIGGGRGRGRNYKDIDVPRVSGYR